MSDDLHIQWRSPGPVATAFKASRGFIQGFMGPVGSGKTQTIATKLIELATEQRPSPRTRVRMVKFTVVHATYRLLWKNVIPSWWVVMPKDSGHWVGAEGDPATHTINLGLDDGTEAELVMDFIAIGDNRAEEVLRGYQPTGAWLCEADLLDRSVFAYMVTRVGRYPSKDDGGPSWAGIICDFNAPDVDNWTYATFVEDRAANTEFFRQPSGLSPQAENIANLPPGYYENQIAVLADWQARRLVRNEFGYSRHGKPVFPEFEDARHVAAEPLLPARGLPICIGLDAGLNPAAVLAQRMPNGQWRWIDELVGEHGTGALRFGDDLARLLASEPYRGWPKLAGWADPSAAYGADKRAGEQDWITMVSKRAGLRIRPAPTNALLPRLESVRRPLTQTIDNAPAFLLSPKCKLLRKAFNSDYRYKRLQVPGSDRYEEAPDKTNYASHPMDAGQYVMLGEGEYLELTERKRPAGPRQVRARSDYDPLAV